MGRILEHSKFRLDRFPNYDSFKSPILKHLHLFKTSGTETDKSIAMSNKIRSYAGLRERIRVSLWIQNPECIEPNGDSLLWDPMRLELRNYFDLPSAEDEAAGV